MQKFNRTKSDKSQLKRQSCFWKKAITLGISLYLQHIHAVWCRTRKFETRQQSTPKNQWNTSETPEPSRVGCENLQQRYPDPWFCLSINTTYRQTLKASGLDWLEHFSSIKLPILSHLSSQVHSPFVWQPFFRRDWLWWIINNTNI